MKILKDLSEQEILNKIIEKKEFSKLPLEDVKLVYSQFGERGDLLLEEKIKLTRDSLRKIYTAFFSDKIFTSKEKDADWFFQKHISTKERYKFYSEVYSRCLKDFLNLEGEKLNIFDFGCGANGFSYDFFLKLNLKIKYFGTEPVGQLCDLQNKWFKKNKYDAEIKHLSLFNLQENKNLILSSKGKKIVFLFKVLDSLEMIKKDYSKEILREFTAMSDIVVVSWATRSLVSKKKFKANRSWLKTFIYDSFKVLDDFETECENYIIFRSN